MDVNARGLGRRVRPWLALALPPLAWYAFELGLLTMVAVSCERAGSWMGVVWEASSLALCGIAIGIAWPVVASAPDPMSSRPWIARVALFVAGIFALAIGFQTLAAWLVPACAR